MRVNVVRWLIWAAIFAGSGTLGAAEPPPLATTFPTHSVTTDAPILPPLPEAQPGLSAQPSVVVREIRFTGNQRIPAGELRDVVKGFVGRALTMDDLEAARIALTKHLVERGYINSGAVLPDQTVDNGVVTFQIVEGRLSDIRMSGNKHLRSNYITSRLRQSAEPPPMNIFSIKDQLELLRQDPNLRSIQAELRPGAAPGESVLDVQVQEAEPWTLALVYSNRRPPSVGSTAVDVLLGHHNLTGNGDALFVRYDVLNGAPADMQFAGTDDFSVNYAIPISPSDTTLIFDFARTDSVVVETPFENLDIDSSLNSIAVTLRQPLYRRPVAEPSTATSPGRPAVEVALFVTGTGHDDHTTLLGRGFSFSPGSDNGRSRVVAIRIGQELSTRSVRDALSVRSTFSFGLPLFDATEHGGQVPDGQFIAWLGQAQYVRRVPGLKVLPDDTQFVVRAAAQLSNSPLLTAEQFAIGGFDTVRGYRENTLVRDQGVAGSVELRIPLLPGKRGGGDNVLTLVPFVDVGYGSDLGANAAGGRTHGEGLSSVGVGLTYAPGPHVAAQLFYGYQLMNKTDTHQDLQDVGLHFNLTVSAF